MILKLSFSGLDVSPELLTPSKKTMYRCDRSIAEEPADAERKLSVVPTMSATISTNNSVRKLGDRTIDVVIRCADMLILPTRWLVLSFRVYSYCIYLLIMPSKDHAV